VFTPYFTPIFCARLSEAGKKAAMMIEEVEEAAALRVAEMEESLEESLLIAHMSVYGNNH